MQIEANTTVYKSHHISQIYNIISVYYGVLPSHVTQNYADLIFLKKRKQYMDIDIHFSKFDISNNIQSCTHPLWNSKSIFMAFG